MGIAISTTESSIRSNALRAFARQPVTHTPAGICLGRSWPLHQEHLSLQDVTGNDKETARIFADVHERLDADIIIPGAGATAFIARALGSDVRFDAKGAPQIIHGALEDRPDPDTLDSQQIWRDPAVQYIFESVSTLAQLNAGKRLILASGRSAFTIAGQLLGLENLSRALYKDKGYAHAILDWVSDICCAYYTRMLVIDGVDGAFIADPSASGDVISPRHFEEFALPHIQRIADLVQATGKVSMLHICGDITDRLLVLADSGIDCLSLDHKVNITTAHVLVGDKVSLAGNVDPVRILEFGTRTQVQDAVTQCLHDGANIILPGCDLGYGVPWENIDTFVRAAHTGRTTFQSEVKQ